MWRGVISGAYAQACGGNGDAPPSRDTALCWRVLGAMVAAKSDDVSQAIIGVLEKGQDDKALNASTRATMTTPMALPSPEAILKVNQLLFKGDRKAALEEAVTAGLWGQAMVIASVVGTQEYQDTVMRFTKSPSHFAPGSALATLYLVMSGNAKTARKHMLEAIMRSNTSTSSTTDQTWRAHLIALLGNRTSGDEKIMSFLGDALWALGGASNVAAAHICYLAAGRGLENIPSSIPTLPKAGISQDALAEELE